MKERFKFKYSANEKDELEVIRSKYVKEETPRDKMDELRRLDASAEKKASAVSLSVGTAGTLIFGMGMSCALVWDLLALGVIVGIFGVAVLSIAYALYRKVLKLQRDKIAPDVLRLIDEINQLK